MPSSSSGEPTNSTDSTDSTEMTSLTSEGGLDSLLDAFNALTFVWNNLGSIGEQEQVISSIGQIQEYLGVDDQDPVLSGEIAEDWVGYFRDADEVHYNSFVRLLNRLHRNMDHVLQGREWEYRQAIVGLIGGVVNPMFNQIPPSELSAATTHHHRRGAHHGHGHHGHGHHGRGGHNHH